MKHIIDMSIALYDTDRFFKRICSPFYVDDY